MKKFLIMSVMLMASVCFAMAQQNQASIKFDKMIHNFGTFSEDQPTQKCVFIINQAVASCGCTIPSYTKAPIKPGEKGEIKVTYNGTGAFPGHFKKTITVRTNGVTELTRLYIEGVMSENKK